MFSELSNAFAGVWLYLQKSGILFGENDRRHDPMDRKNSPRIGCVVMAAGTEQARLLRQHDGKALIARALDAVPPELAGGALAAVDDGHGAAEVFGDGPADDVTVSGSKSNDITLVYGTRQTATVRYLLQDPVTNATSHASLADVVLTGWPKQPFSSGDNYDKITKSVPGYSVNTYYLDHDANFDTIDDSTKAQMIYLYLVPQANG